MTSPGGTVIGRVSVKVLPDVSDFGAQLQAQLEAIESSLRLQIPVELATADLVAELQRAQAVLEASTAAIRLPTRLDTAGAVQEAARIAAEAEAAAGRVDIPVDVDTAGGLAQLGVLSAAVRALEQNAVVDVRVNVDRNAILADMAAISARLRNFGREQSRNPDLAVAIPARLTPNDDDIHADLLTLRRRVARSFGTDDGINIPARFDRHTDLRLLHDFAAIRRRLSATIGDGLSVPVTANAEDIDRDRLRNSLADLSRRLALAGDGISIPVSDREIERTRNRIDEGLRNLKPILVDVDAVKGFAERMRAKIRAALRGVEADIPLNLRGEQFRAELRAAVAAAEATLEVDIPLTVHTAPRFQEKALAAVAEIEALVSAFKPTIEVDVDVDRAGLLARKLGEVGRGVSRLTAGFRSLVRLTERFIGVGAFAQQLTLILARAAAYTVLLGPPIALALSGALALGPAFATAVPILGALAGIIAVVKLGLDGLLGAKIDGNRIGGPFQNLRDAAVKFREELNRVITLGIEPLSRQFEKLTFGKFEAGLLGLAAVVNGTIRDLLTFATTAEGVDLVAKNFEAVTKEAGLLRTVLTPTARALLQIGKDSIPGLDVLNDAILRITLRFDAFIDRTSKSGALSQAIAQSSADLVGFAAGFGRVVSELTRLLLNLEPASRKAFGGLRDGLVSAIRGVNNALTNFNLADSPLGGLLVGLGDILGSVKAVVPAIIRAFQPLVRSTQFGDFLSSLADVSVALARVMDSLTDAFSRTFGSLLAIVGVPIVGLFADLGRVVAGTLNVLSQHQALLKTIATILIVRYVPAVAAAFAATRAFVLVNIVGAITSAATAIGVFVARIPAYIALVRTFGFGILGVGAGFRAAATSALAARVAIGAATFGLAVLATSLILDWTKAGDVVGDAFQKIEDGFDIPQPNGLTELNRELDAARVKSLAAADAQNGTLDKVAAGYRKLDKILKPINDKIDRIFEPPGTTAADRAKKEADANNSLAGKILGLNLAQKRLNAVNEEAARVYEELSKKINNFGANSAGVTAITGATADAVREAAASMGVDFTKSFNDSAADRAKVIDYFKAVELRTGFTAAAISSLATTTGQSFSAMSKAAEDAIKAVDQAFKKDTDVLGSFDLSKQEDKIAKASEKVAAARQRVNDIEARLAAKRKQTVGDAQALERAERNLVRAQEDLNAAQAKSGLPGLKRQYEETLTLALRFTQDIDKAFQAGLDPAVISRLLQAGPQQATPILEAILSDHTGRMIDIVNAAEGALAEINAQVLLQQRILWVATQSEAAKGSDRYIAEVNDAMRISALAFQKGGKASIEALAKELKLPPDRVAAIVQDFGITVADLQEYANKHPIILQVKMPVRTGPDGQEIDRLPGGRQRFRDGGLVRGPGSPTSDSIPAWLSDREFVTQASAVQHYGVDVMEALNARRLDPGLLRAAVSRGFDGRQLAVVTKTLAATAKRIELAAADLAVQHRPVPRASSADRVIGPETPTSATGAGRGRSDFYLLDADGNLIGRMRGEAAGVAHRARRRARLSRLASWGDASAWQE